jgi:hypothetical protein
MADQSNERDRMENARDPLILYRQELLTRALELRDALSTYLKRFPLGAKAQELIGGMNDLVVIRLSELDQARGGNGTWESLLSLFAGSRSSGLLSAYDLEDVGRALAGGNTNFTVQLLHLIAKADPDRKRQLAVAFPEAVAAYERWVVPATLRSRGPGGDSNT